MKVGGLTWALSSAAPTTDPTGTGRPSPNHDPAMLLNSGNKIAVAVVEGWLLFSGSGRTGCSVLALGRMVGSVCAGAIRRCYVGRCSGGPPPFATWSHFSRWSCSSLMAGAGLSLAACWISRAFSSSPSPSPQIPFPSLQPSQPTALPLSLLLPLHHPPPHSVSVHSHPPHTLFAPFPTFTLSPQPSSIPTVHLTPYHSLSLPHPQPNSHSSPHIIPIPPPLALLYPLLHSTPHYLISYTPHHLHPLLPPYLSGQALAGACRLCRARRILGGRDRSMRSARPAIVAIQSRCAGQEGQRHHERALAGCRRNGSGCGVPALPRASAGCGGDGAGSALNQGHLSFLRARAEAGIEWAGRHRDDLVFPLLRPRAVICSGPALRRRESRPRRVNQFIDLGSEEARTRGVAVDGQGAEMKYGRKTRRCSHLGLPPNGGRAGFLDRPGKVGATRRWPEDEKRTVCRWESGPIAHPIVQRRKTRRRPLGRRERRRLRRPPLPGACAFSSWRVDWGPACRPSRIVVTGRQP